MLKLALKSILKCYYMFRFNKPSSGSLLLCFAKVIIIKIFSLKRHYESVRSCGCIFIQSLLLCVQCKVQSETVIGVCAVHSVAWKRYWCVCSEQCRVRLLLVCVQCTVKSESVIGVCAVHSVEWDRYWCVYSVQCRVRLLLVCVQCRVQSETVIGVCAVNSVECDCYWCVCSAQCRVRLLLVCVQWTV